MENSFLESQINQRRRGDEEMFKGAFSDLLSIIGIETPKMVSMAKGAVAQILRHLGKEVPHIPDNITTLDAQLDYMLKPSNTMKRRVELRGEWWKDSTGCLLASTKSGEVVAILPGKWSGYEYVNKNGEKIKINKETAKDLNVDAFCFFIKHFRLNLLRLRI